MVANKGLASCISEIGKHMIGLHLLQLNFEGFCILLCNLLIYSYIFRCELISDNGVKKLALEIGRHFPKLNDLTLNFSEYLQTFLIFVIEMKVLSLILILSLDVLR